jgi:outer membrane immunogenic protein
MKTKALIAGALLATSVCATALGQTPDNPTGPYIGGGWGQFNLDIDNADDVGQGLQAAIKDNDNAYKFFVGWRLRPWLALEAAYVNLGEPGDAISSSGRNGDYSVKADGFSPSVIGSFPLGPVELFGKVGYYFYDVDASVSLDNGQVFSGKSSGNDFVYGGGVGITFLQHLHVRAEYERFNLDNADSSDTVWVSAAWRF